MILLKASIYNDTGEDQKHATLNDKIISTHGVSVNELHICLSKNSDSAARIYRVLGKELRFWEATASVTEILLM